MSRGINKVILVGNLGGDPEVRHTGGGTAVTTINIATSESWTDKQSGEKQERTEWHRVKLFGRLAEIAGDYLKKGRQVYIEGSLRTDKYTDKQGVERYTTDVIASEMQMLGADKDHQSSQGGEQRRSDAPQGQNRQSNQSGRNQQQPARSNGGSNGGNYGTSNREYQGGDPSFGHPSDDDIPFAALPRRSPVF